MSTNVETSFPFTEAQYDKMAAEFEDGTWQSGGAEVTAGRPRLFNEDMETISFRLPQSRIHAVDVVAKRQGISKSEFLRRAIDAALIAAG